MLAKYIFGAILFASSLVMARPVVYLVPHVPTWGKNWPSSYERAKDGSWAEQLLWGNFGRLEEKLNEMGYDFKPSPMTWISKFSGPALKRLFDPKNPDRIVGILFHGTVPPEIQKKLPPHLCMLFSTANPGIFIDYPKMVLNKTHQFGKILTWDDQLVHRKGFIKHYYPCLWPMRDDTPSFKDRNLACMVLSNKWFCASKEELYTERRNLIKYIHANKASLVDLYGAGWKAYPKIWKGTAPHKLDKLQNYRFNFAIENARNVKGWITERIFESFQMGCVPIYYGASNITDYIPKNCFVDYRDFKSYNDLFRFMEAFTEEDYNRYMVNIREFLNSDGAQRFTPENFANTVISAFGLK